ncbi:FecR protein [Rubripirellula tenax]|uniref:FecR protein n=1 Tax=Rubripirellula tenax TaxID=2528015 RepID=A0A5C6E966_9BACT|nr:FecR domain-containing protein [Rubripirellula tenax]TWU46203.1 FecR protein [Rubripirellula tenax]
MNDNERFLFECRIAAYQDGGLDEAELAKFENEMRKDPEKLRLFIGVQRQTGAMIELFRNEAFQIADHDHCDDGNLSRDNIALPLSRGSDEADREHSRRYRSRNTWFTVAAVAAVILAMFTVGALAIRDELAKGLVANNGSATDPIRDDLNAKDPGLSDSAQLEALSQIEARGAIITYGSQATWSDGKTRSLRDRLVDGQRYQLVSGATRFRMAGGAIVSIGGPAEFSIADSTTIDFISGRLTARLPDKNSDLKVRAGDMEVRDLGTAFGLTMAADGKVDVAVFDGEVTARINGDINQTQGKTFGQGMGFSADIDSERLEPIPYAPEPYQDIWPLTVGINDVSDLIEFVPPGRNQSLPLLADDHKLFLVAEQLNRRIDHPLRVDLLGAGQSWPLTRENRHRLGEGRFVSSYLLIYQPDAIENRTTLSISGSISFQHEILGVAVSPSQLSKTDDIFGLPGIDYSKFDLRRLEHIPTDSGRVPADILQASEDGRELHFTLYVSSGMDHIRVLVDDGNPTTKARIVGGE